MIRSTFLNIKRLFNETFGHGSCADLEEDPDPTLKHFNILYLQSRFDVKKKSGPLSPSKHGYSSELTPHPLTLLANLL